MSYIAAACVCACVCCFHRAVALFLETQRGVHALGSLPTMCCAEVRFNGACRMGLVKELTDENTKLVDENKHLADR